MATAGTFTYSLTGASFSDGTTLSGSWSVTYNAAGTITSISNLNLTATLNGKSTIFTTENTQYEDLTPVGGDYQIHLAPTNTTGASFGNLYLDWAGQTPAALLGGNTTHYSSVVNNTSGATVTLASTGAGAIANSQSYNLTGATFTDGTTLSGSWTVTYNSAGAITGISAINLSATLNGKTTVFTTQNTQYEVLTPGTNGDYQIHLTPTSTTGAAYSDLYVDWNSETPTSLVGGTTGVYSSIHNNTSNTTVTLNNAGAVTDAPCFAAGTLIRTVTGEIAVEALKQGDEVVLERGTTAPVVWIGSRTIDVRRHPRPDAVQPVRVAAGALGQGLPARDLVLSPDHALHLDGVLIPVKTLVNGCNVVQLDVESVTYFHVELPAHGVLLAEGAPAESYLDTGNHGVFAAPGQPVMHPSAAQLLRERESCAPLAERGAAVERVRADILSRAGARFTSACAWSIEYAGEAAIIRSDSAVPAEVQPDPGDRRRLGIKVGSLVIAGRVIPLNHPALQQGWHGLEADGRWTDGAAVVPSSLLQGCRDLAVTISATLPFYPVASIAA